MQVLLNQLYIVIGVEMTTSDNVSNKFTMVLHGVSLALNVQSNIKQMNLYNMKYRNWYPELGVGIVDFKLPVCWLS